MKFKRRRHLEDLSVLAFGRKSRYKTIMDRGRWDGNQTCPISDVEIEDTMLFLIRERKKQDDLRTQAVTRGNRPTQQNSSGQESAEVEKSSGSSEE